MKLTKGSAAIVITAFILFSTAFFQNCSKVNVQDTGSEHIESIYEMKYSTARIGEELSLPDLKLFFVVDNSFTMANSNIQLSTAFQDIFSSNALDKFNAEVFILNTAQNIEKNSPSSRNHALVNYIKNRGYGQLTARSYNDVLNTERGSLITGTIPGDLAGFELHDIPNMVGTKDVVLSLAPVLGLKPNDVGGADWDLSIKKAAGAGTVELNNEFKNRLKVINPNNNNVDQNSIFSATMSEESGLCTMARLMRNSEQYFHAGDVTAFILISDENDSYEHGKNCVQAFRQKLDPNQYVSGQCQWHETTVTYKRNQTKFNYVVNIPGAAAKPSKCVISKTNQFSIKYKYVPISTVVTNYTTKVYFYTSYQRIRDGQVETLIDTNIKSQVVAQNMDGRCNQANLASLLPASTVYGNASYPVTCDPAVGTNSTVNSIENYKSSDAFWTGKIAYTDTRLSTYSITAADIGAKDSDCSAKLRSLITDNEPSIKNSSRQLAECKIEGLFYNGSSTAGTDSSTDGLTSAECTVKLNTCKASNQICTQSYTNAVAATNPTTSAKSQVVNEVISDCAALCSSTTFCKSYGAIPIQDYFSKINSNNSIASCSATAQVEAATQTQGIYEGVFDCSTACRDTKLCPTMGLMTVQAYLQSLYPTLNTCGISTTTTPKSTSFGPVLAGTQNICAKGTPVYDASTPPQYLDWIDYVSETNPATGLPVKDLPTYIKDRTNEIFGSNKPFFSSFVIQPGDSLQGQQSVGTQYNSLMSLLNGQSYSILSSSYSPALQGLGSVLSSRLSRSVKFGEIQPTNVIRRVWLNGRELKSSTEYTTAGQIVTIDSSVIVNHLDEIRIEYY